MTKNPSPLNPVELQNEPITNEVKKQFENVLLATPERMAFVQDDRGIITEVVSLLKDQDGKTLSFAMDSHIFLGWTSQVSKIIIESIKDKVKIETKN